MSRRSTPRKSRAAAKPQHPQPPLCERREPVPSALPQRRGFWLVPALIALITFAAFLPALQNQFVNWDDKDNFLDNPHYRGLGWTHLRWMWTTHLGHYIPLTWMTLGLDYLLWGMNPVRYHLTNLLLHAANAVVFFFVVLRILTRALSSPSERGHALALSAGFASLVFAIHPLRVESVAWATERRDVLSGLFYLLTILEYLRAREPEKRGRWWYWLSVVTFVCALLSKSMVVNLPVVLLILEVYPLRRLGGAIGWWSAPARRVYVEKIPFVLLAAAASAIAFMAQFSAQTAASLAQLSVLGRLAVSAYGLSFYLGKLVVPVNLSPLYELPPTVNPGALPFILSYGLVLAITALVLGSAGECRACWQHGWLTSWSSFRCSGSFRSACRLLLIDTPTSQASAGRSWPAPACCPAGEPRGGRRRGHQQLCWLQASPYVSLWGWEFSPGTRSRSGVTQSGFGPMPLQLTLTLPSPRITSDMSSIAGANSPRRSTTIGRPCASSLTMRSPTPTGARRSVVRASRPRPSITIGRLCASSLATPLPTPTGA